MQKGEQKGKGSGRLIKLENKFKMKMMVIEVER